MPRANRYFVPGLVWHITHRCHQHEFLLKFAQDRQCWLHWLFEAKKRYGLCVLNYIVTSNHIHLLVWETEAEVIAMSLQLLAGRTAQAYNQRKRRNGAFWEDRYHATAIQTGESLARCLAYIDLNMVRAGVVTHPREWQESGYCELQTPPRRYRIVNTSVLMELVGVKDMHQLQAAWTHWVEELLSTPTPREAAWTESLAVGTRTFAEEVKATLGIRARAREVVPEAAGFVLKEAATAYRASFEGKKGRVRDGNGKFLGES